MTDDTVTLIDYLEAAEETRRSFQDNQAAPSDERMSRYECCRAKEKAIGRKLLEQIGMDASDQELEKLEFFAFYSRILGGGAE